MRSREVLATGLDEVETTLLSWGPVEKAVRVQDRRNTIQGE